MSVTNKELVAQYEQLHKGRKYGQSARSAARSIERCLAELNPGVTLEYGCGQSRLHEILQRPGMIFDRYDPAIPPLATIPREHYDFLISTDVLEHIPTEDVPEVLAHMRRLSSHAFLRISTRPARTILPDGRNAHLTVWPGDKWLEAVRIQFPAASLVFEIKGESCVILTWKSAAANEITRIETKLEQQRRGRAKQFFKRIERFLRSLRDRVLGGKGSKSTGQR